MTTAHKIPVLSSFTWQKPVIDMTHSSPPGGESKGDRYIVLATGSGGWSGYDKYIAEYTGTGWEFTQPRVGMTVYNLGDGAFYKYTTSWVAFENDPSSLHLDQTTPQTVANGTPAFTSGTIQGADANKTDFSAATTVISNGDTGGTSTTKTALALEAQAGSGSAGRGLLTIGRATGALQGQGVYALGKVTDTADTGTAYGGIFYSTDTHAGGQNIAVYGSASGGTSNYSFYGSSGYASFENIVDRGLTASELVATDANKALQSLTVATYPSLTEISYVKGATSAIQEQINGKIGGSLTSTRIPFASGTTTLSDDSSLSWDNTGKILQTTTINVTGNIAFQGTTTRTINTPAGSAGVNGTALTITSGAGAASAASPSNGGAFSFTTGVGGASSGDAVQGGVGGATTITTGNGGENMTAGSTRSNGGNGGAVTLTTGTGGRAGGNSTTNAPGNGGGFTLSTGSGGAIVGGVAGDVAGNGGAMNMTAGTGGATNTAGTTGGAGGSSTITCGSGGAGSTHGTTCGAGGALTVRAGTGGSVTTVGAGVNTGGAGGATSLTGGTGGTAQGSSTTNTAGAGGNLTLAGGIGGSSASGSGTRQGGNGGTVSIAGGAGSATNGSGGSVYILGGAKNGTGTVGNTFLGVNSSGTATGRIFVGTTTSTGGEVQIRATTEQLRVEYDSSNYYTTTVSSTGGVTYDAVGAGAAFSFSDAMSINGNLSFLGTTVRTISTPTGSAGTDGTQLSVTTGAGAASTTTPSAGGIFALTTGAGGAATGGTVAGAIGGNISLTSGAGGANVTASASTITGGNGGNFSFTSGAGGTAGGSSTFNVPGTGGSFSLTSGAGGAINTGSSGTGTGGAGGVITITSGNGGATNVANTTGGTSGALQFTGGVGGAGTTSGTTGGAGGSFIFAGGIGGASATVGSGVNTGGAGGDFTLTGGLGGAANGSSTTNTAGVGGNLVFTGGRGGASQTGSGTKAGGNGGNATIAGGDGYTTNGSGGSVYLLGGGKDGTGTVGNVFLGIGSTGSAVGRVIAGTTTLTGGEVQIRSTTEQLRVEYDSSNYYSTTVGSSGGVTFDATGAGAIFNFSDDTAHLSDTVKAWFGAGKDMSVWYDGTKGNIKTSDIAASDLSIDCGTDKTLVLVEPVYDDVRVTPAGFDRAGVADPSLVSYTPTGSSIATYLYEFQKDDIAYFTVQLPHSYKVGEDIKVHVHWTPGLRGNEENGATVGWKVDYVWANINGTFGAMQTADLSDACDGTDDKHQMTPDVTIDGHTAAKGISSMLLCNIKRTDTGTDDTWAGTASGELPMLLEIDFHFPIDTLGSRDWGTK